MEASGHLNVPAVLSLWKGSFYPLHWRMGESWAGQYVAELGKLYVPVRYQNLILLSLNK